MAVSHVAPIVSTLAAIGLRGKIEKDGTIGVNVESLTDLNLRALRMVRSVTDSSLRIKRSGTGLRLTFTLGRTNVPAPAVTIDFEYLKAKVEKVGTAGFNLEFIDDAGFEALLEFRYETNYLMSLKRSGTGLRITITK